MSFATLKKYLSLTNTAIALVVISCLLFFASNQNKEIRFTSVPDFFNWNINNPQPGWEESIDWFLNLLQSEGSDFTLNAGDIMDARWWSDETQVREQTSRYWPGFKRRFDERNMTIYIAPGDHEYGDDQGLEISNIARTFGQQFADLMEMPRNGPANHVGRAYYVRKKNLLLISLDTFEEGKAKFNYTVGSDQLAWMENVLVENQDADFILVQGHLPIVGPVNSQDSSASMLEGGTDSDLWKLMVRHNVTAYLCGEHHRITVKKHDGIWQIVHGALWGTQTDLNYLRGSVRSDSIKLELLEFDVEYGGGYIGNHPHRDVANRPRESVILSQATRTEGPRLTGRLILEKDSNGRIEELATFGWFQDAIEVRP